MLAQFCFVFGTDHLLQASSNLCELSSRIGSGFRHNILERLSWATLIYITYGGCAILRIVLSKEHCYTVFVVTTVSNNLCDNQLEKDICSILCFQT